MSYDFYSLVSSIKDKSSQAMATLSSDLMEFSTIVQEDVAEVAKTVRKTVHEKSEAFRQLAEQQRQEIEKEEHGETEETSGLLHDEEEEKEEEKQENDEEEKDETPAASTVSTTASSLFSFASLSLEQVSSKLLHTADELLGALAGTGEGEEGAEDEDAVESARRYRLLALQEDPDTYTEPPMDVETFQKWRTSVSSDELASVQAEVLAHYPAVVEKLAELVPGTLSEEDFWAHYIYKASLLAAQEQRGADLLEHALNDSEEEVSWDADSPRAGAAEDATEKTFEAESTPAVPSIVDVSGADEARAMETASSDGESWIELDEQRRDAIQQPPLSSSSTSSFVPVVAQHDGVPASAPLQQHDEEDLTWGEDDEQIATATTTTEATESKPAAGVKTATASNRQGDDWGEWD